jgi:hypothetical protein
MISNTLNFVQSLPVMLFQFFKEHLGKLSAHTLGWLSIVLMHLATAPTLASVLLSKTDQLPPVDLVLFLWMALITLFFKSLIEKNFLYIATNCVGFVAQTVVMSLILFK